MSKPNRKPFETKKRLEDGVWREVAVLTCAVCGAHGEIPVVSRAGRMNLHATVAAAVDAGWVVSADSARAECPQCARKRRDRAAGESPRVAVLRSVAAIKKEVSVSDAKLREATYEERLKIREALDKFFDDQAGCWLEGWSDQKAGEHAGVPWAIVTRIREAAYGPIKADPEIVALRAQIAQIGRDIRTTAEKHDAVVKDLIDRIQALSKRLDSYSTKRVA